jgi:hypothetical protein
MHAQSSSVLLLACGAHWWLVDPPGCHAQTIKPCNNGWAAALYMHYFTNGSLACQAMFWSVSRYLACQVEGSLPLIYCSFTSCWFGKCCDHVSARHQHRLSWPQSQHPRTVHAKFHVLPPTLLQHPLGVLPLSCCTDNVYSFDDNRKDRGTLSFVIWPLTGPRHSVFPVRYLVERSLQRKGGRLAVGLSS